MPARRVINWGADDIVVGTGYASTEESLAHCGLGDAKTCDLEVTWGSQTVRQANVAANQSLTITFDAPISSK